MSKEFKRRIKKWYRSLSSKQRFTKRQEILFEQYNNETKKTALNKNGEITHAFKTWEHEIENRQEELKKEILDMPSIEKSKDLVFTDFLEVESRKRIFDKLVAEMEMVMTAISKWISENCDSELYNNFLDFIRDRLMECEQLDFEIE